MIQIPQRRCIQLLADIACALRPQIDAFLDRDTIQEIDHAINFAVIAAKGQLPRPDLEELATATTKLTGRAVLYSMGLYPEESDRDTPLGRLTSDQLLLVRDIANISARSLWASVRSESEANYECQEALASAYDMAGRLSDDGAILRQVHSLVDNATT